ncbi:MAG TPA: VCBS repeat-containing protein [Planctomycetota bacterium]|nr:VCBS repeat-containing protein [Planctomycetota bacterium]
MAAPLVLALGLVVPQSVGLFGSPATFPTGGVPTTVLAGDLDRDGALDLVAPTTAATTSILLGDGHGAFAAASPVAASGATVLGDLTGDGILDLVTGSGSAVEIRAGDGAGGFGAPASFSATSPHAMSAADVDADGDLDLVATADGRAGLFVHLGDGAGALAAETTAAPGDAGGELALGDFDGNGLPDAATSRADVLSIALATGGGGFATSYSQVSPSSAFFPFGAVAVADVTEDGRLDVVAARNDLHFLLAVGFLVLVGDGAGGAAGSIPLNQTSAFPVAFSVSDVTGDGRSDLSFVRANLFAPSVYVREGLGGGSFAASVPYASGGTARFVTTADLDGSGRLDVAAANLESNVGVLLNVAPLPAGLTTSGTGTPGCAGIHGIAATSPPTLGNAAFAIVTTGAPPSSLGLLLVADVADPVGHDVFGIGVIEHLDFFASSLLLPLNALSDGAGYGLAPVPIPNVASFAGATVHAQTKWLWLGAVACDPSPFGLSSSKLLSIVLGP